MLFLRRKWAGLLGMCVILLLVTTGVYAGNAPQNVHSPAALGPGQIAKLSFDSKPLTFEVNFLPGQSYTVSVKARNAATAGFPLEVYQKGKLVCAKELVGDGGEICLTSARGSGKLDLVAIMAGGNAGYLNDFVIIGDTGNGIGILADESVLEKGYTWPEITHFADKIGIEFNPAGAWTRYRTDIVWKPETGKYVSAKSVRITPASPIPAADKTIYFSLKPQDEKVKYFVGGNIVSEVRIKAGSRLLLRRDPKMSEELALGYWADFDESVIKPEVVGGNILVTAKKPGVTKISLYQPHNAPTTQELAIIVEP